MRRPWESRKGPSSLGDEGPFLSLEDEVYIVAFNCICSRGWRVDLQSTSVSVWGGWRQEKLEVEESGRESRGARCLWGRWTWGEDLGRVGLFSGN